MVFWAPRLCVYGCCLSTPSTFPSSLTGHQTQALCWGLPSRTQHCETGWCNAHCRWLFSKRSTWFFKFGSKFCCAVLRWDSVSYSSYTWWVNHPLSGRGKPEALVFSPWHLSKWKKQRKSGCVAVQAFVNKLPGWYKCSLASSMTEHGHMGRQTQLKAKEIETTDKIWTKPSTSCS